MDFVRKVLAPLWALLVAAGCTRPELPRPRAETRAATESRQVAAEAPVSPEEAPAPVQATEETEVSVQRRQNDLDVAHREAERDFGAPLPNPVLGKLADEAPQALDAAASASDPLAPAIIIGAPQRD